MKKLITIIPFFDFFGSRHFYKNHRKQVGVLKQQGVDNITIECGLKNKFKLKEEEAFRLNTNCVLWQKEAMINYAAKKLIEYYENIAFIDSGLILENNWAEKSIEKLNHYDIIQPFSHGLWIDKTGKVDRINDGYVWWKKNNTRFNQNNYPSTGICWIVKRDFFITDSLYDRAIVGGGDRIFANAILPSDRAESDIQSSNNKHSLNEINKWTQKIRNKKYTVDCIDGYFTHLWHGDMPSRQYKKRYNILINHDFNPKTDIINHNGVLELRKGKENMHKDIQKFFYGRTI